ncbi:MAG: helix-turn-helix transcriptional regulator [Deltaproteobacteria bacterium]|jgi:DNA-binding Xre family transcriptional regulator|nr:helix-turn-helix transcriptional regulator [Deltaproteobacteria bacterium]
MLIEVNGLIMNLFAIKLSLYLNHFKVSVEELKKLAGLDNATFAELIIWGKVSEETKQRICDALDVTEEEILDFPLRRRKTKVFDRSCYGIEEPEPVKTTARRVLKFKKRKPGGDLVKG